MQKEWNKLLLFAIATGVKNIMRQIDAGFVRLGAGEVRKADFDLADTYSAAVKDYKKELGL